jgi:pSer/pThr/pTyr-binding forkhead associated (FHA) protein
MPKIIITNPDGSTVKYGLNGRNFTVGRAENNDIVLPGGSSSNHHAVLKQTESGDFAITDLDSTNHTRVNNIVVQSAVLRNGDSLMFGDIVAAYESEFVASDDQATQIYETRPQAASAPAAPPKAAPAPVPNRAPVPIQRAAPQASGTYTATDGCFALILFGLLAAFAFVGGAWARHSQDHKGQSLSKWIKDVMAERQTGKPLEPK